MQSDDEQTKHDQTFTRRFIAVFSLMLCGFFGAYAWQVTFGLVPKDNLPNANLILGFLIGTAVSTPIAYWMGSSKQSSNSTPATNPATAIIAEPVLPAPAQPVKDSPV